MRLLTIFFTILLLPAICLSVEIIPYPDNITVAVTPLQSKFDTSDNILVKVQFINSSENDVRFLVWGTPFEGRINTDFFNVQVENGLPLPYMGRMYKRGEPDDTDYKTLQPGETIEAIVNLNDAYNLREAGNYTLQYTDKGKHGQRKDVANKQSGFASFLLEDTGALRSYKKTPDFSSCSGSRQSTLNSALSQAENLSKTAKNDLQNTPASFRAGAPRSTEWFGSYSESRYSKARSNFEKIYSAASGQTIGFDCSCTDSSYAYVYANDPYNIYLCNAFWGAPLTGTDSKAGTIIHELSHFTVVAGTDDYVYGQSGARNLADTSPALAVGNADNHEYFAENTPYLSMPTTIPVYKAVDNVSLSWETGGHQSFFGQTNTFSYGGDAAQSGAISDNQYSYLRTTLPSSGKVTFIWRVSSEYSHDFLEFRVNNSVRHRISGEVGWQQQSYTLRGVNTVEWRYLNDSSGSVGSNAGWVDKVTFEEIEDRSVTPILQILLNDGK